MTLKLDLTGMVFGQLKVIEFVGRVNKHSMFKCLCDCGNTSTVTSNNLRRNHTTSCGCASSKKTIGARTGTHFLTKHPLHRKWLDMRNRCYWEKHNRFKHYGGKGIEVCSEWKDNFPAFYEWAINNGWEFGLTLDRKENDKNYAPDNCRFRTVKEQNRNKTNNFRITIDGETKILKEWSEISGLHITTIKKRIRNGWSNKDAVFKKKR